MFSPFNEAFHKSFSFGQSGRRFVIPKKIRQVVFSAAESSNISVRKLGYLSVDRFVEDLKKLDVKVHSLWGVTKKILLLYDNSRAPKWILPRLELFNRVAKNVLNWEHIAVRDRNKKNKVDNTWPHYSSSVYLCLYNNISTLERDHD